MSQEKQEYRWYKVTERAPDIMQKVWGMFKGRSVELCQLSLGEIEYKNYMEWCEEGIWYSIESEKGGCVTFWHPVKRPEKIFEIK